MITARTKISVACVLLALGWLGAASAADLEIKKAHIQPAGPIFSHTAIKQAPESHRPIRLALQDDVRMPVYPGPIGIGIILGIGY